MISDPADEEVIASIEELSLSANLRARLRGGFLFNLVGAVFNQGSTVAVNWVVSNLYTPRGIRRICHHMATIATGPALASFGTGYTATKYAAELLSAAGWPGEGFSLVRSEHSASKGGCSSCCAKMSPPGDRLACNI